MSYEGYVQRLCSQGHLSVVDCMDESETRGIWDDGYTPSCLICKEPIAWSNSVDETNHNTPAFSNFRVREAEVVDECHTCNNKKVVKQVTYHVPTADEMKDYSNEVSAYYDKMYDEVIGAR